MKKFIYINTVLFILLFSAIDIYAQRAGGVLISEENGEEKADPSAMLEVRTNEKGVLLPRMTTSERDDIKPNTDALTVFVTDEDEGFWFFDEMEGEWKKLLVVDPETPGMSVPQKAVIMYCGSSNDFDEDGMGKHGTEMQGWHLCNGNNDTPDLTAKFIVGFNPTNTDYDAVGEKGGKKTYTLSEENLPVHDHELDNESTLQANIVHSHQPLDQANSPSNSNDFSGSHHHTMYSRSNGKRKSGEFSRESPRRPSGASTRYTNSASSNIYSIGSATAKITIDIKENIVGLSEGGSKTTIDNRPLYFVLAYIIRIDIEEEE